MDTVPSEQARLVYDVLDALGEVVRALGGPKAVGPRMRPELPHEQAAGWVRDRLNPNRRERFDPDQVLLLLRWGREADCHVAMRFIARTAGYMEPAPVDPQEQVNELQREFVASVERQARLVEEMKRLTQAPLTAVRGRAAQ